jgi:hypothetical protein
MAVGHITLRQNTASDSMTAAAVKRRLFMRDALWAELRQRGLRMSYAAFAQKCAWEMGPPVADRKGNRDLYELEPALAWAEPHINPAEEVEIVT